jgi:hypothetical protein
MSAAGKVLALTVLCVASSALAEEEGPFELVLGPQITTWYAPVPATSAAFVRMVGAGAGGFGFVAGLDEFGTLSGWGSFANTEGVFLPFVVPANLGPCKDVRAVLTAMAAIRVDGTFVVWGGEFASEYPAPKIPEPVVDVELNRAGPFFGVVIGESGKLYAWGSDTMSSGLLTQAPTDISDAIDVAVGYTEATVVRADGSLIRWPAPYSGYSDIVEPAKQVAYFQQYEPLVLREDGTLFKLFGQRGTASVVETGIAEIVHDNWGVIVLRRKSGEVLILDGTGPNAPTPGPLVDAVWTQNGFTGYIVDPFIDCDQSSVDDDDEIASGQSPDCDGNWVPDACQFALGTLEDCNSNGIADSCEKGGAFSLGSGQLSPIGFGNPQSWTVREAPPAASEVVLSLSAVGDFSGNLESLSVTMNGASLGSAFVDGKDCVAMDDATYVIDAAVFNSLMQSGSVTFDFSPTIAVDAGLCPSGTWVSASLTYSAATPLDCNANGLLDECEIAAGYATDCNGNGVPDACDPPANDCNRNGERDDCDVASGFSADCNMNGLPDECELTQSPELDCNSNGQFDSCELEDGSASDCNGNGRPDTCDVADGSSADVNSNDVPDECERFPCPADLNGDRLVNGADLAIVLAFWGPVGVYPPADVDGDGLVAGPDLAIILGTWGLCP